jgi:hypothetical protein
MVVVLWGGGSLNLYISASYPHLTFQTFRILSHFAFACFLCDSATKETIALPLPVSFVALSSPFDARFRAQFIADTATGANMRKTLGDGLKSN